MTAPMRGELDHEQRLALTRYIRRRWPSLDAEDIVQDVCLAFWARHADYDPARPLMAYLYGIARHRVMDRLRDIYRRRDREIVLHDEMADASSHGTATARLDVARLLAELPARQANALIATRLRGLSVNEAAELCEQSASLIKVNCHRGIKRMRHHAEAWASD